MHTMNKAISYIRFSDPSQAQGDSYGRQLRDTLAYCKDNNIELLSDSEYMFFDEGISAFSGKLRDDTTDLSRFLALVKSGDICPGTTLVVESLDRLSREHVRVALIQFLQLLDGGINIHTLQSKKTYTHDSKDDMDLFQSILEMSRSHRESLWKSERIASRWEQKQQEARQGIPLGGGTKPAWLDLVYANGSNKKPDNEPKAKPVGFVENDKVAIIKRIFQLTIDGYGRNVIAQMLNAENIPAFRTTEGWGASTINQILKNEAVLGMYQPYTKGEDGKRVKRGEPFMFYPPIIDRETFNRAKDATAGRNATKARRQSPDFHVWQGIAKCGLCESPLHTYSNGRKPEEGQTARRWMRCYAAKKGKCEAKSLSVVKSEKMFAQILAKLNVLALVQSSANATNAKLEAVAGQLAVERAKLAKFTEDYAKRQSDTILNLIYTTEDAVKALAEQERAYLAMLATDQIIDKEEFFAKLDLKTVAGRSRANSVLKRLKVSVLIDPAQQQYNVVKDGMLAFVAIDQPTEDPTFYPADHQFSGIIQRQEKTFSPHWNRVDDYEDSEDNFASEGHDTRDGY
jgi:DNA invertase Pin-like site-specific DNA recombinase